MLVQDWMIRKVITVSPRDSLLTCRKLFRMHGINSMPVATSGGKLAGIISMADIGKYMPTFPSGLQILDALDLFAETRVGDVMTKTPCTIAPTATIEQAAFAMREGHMSSLVVVDMERRVIGFITATRVFRNLLSLTGATQGSEELGFVFKDRKGPLGEIVSSLLEYPVILVSMLTSQPEEGTHYAKIRYRPLAEGNLDAVDQVIARFRNHPDIRFWTRGGQPLQKEEADSEQR